MALTDMVLMPGKDYQNICERIRFSAIGYPYEETPITSSMVAKAITELEDEVWSTYDQVWAAQEEADWFLEGNSSSTLKDLTNKRVTKLANYALQNRKDLKSATFPNVKNIGASVFGGADKLESVRCPKATSAQTNVFSNCFALIEVDLGSVYSVPANAFSNAKVLKNIVLRRASTPTTLSNTNAFVGTPYAASGTGGTIYVPEALIEAYKTATNWSAIYSYGNCEFVAIEGSEYE